MPPEGHAFPFTWQHTGSGLAGCSSGICQATQTKTILLLPEQGTTLIDHV